MSKRILVVEDQEDNRRILRDLLTSVGFQLVEAEDGAQGVAAAETHRPDLILMDIQMPVVDGYEATRQIKANPALKTIPVIVVTSYALSGDEDKARAAGCDDYITKPYSPRQLLAKIKSICTSLALAIEPFMHTPPRILIVDDNETNRDILRSRLGPQGYELLEAADGEEALAAARQHHPDLILLDVMMPKMDGIEACRQIKADASLPFMPVVLVTAKSDSKDVVAGLEAGADEYLTKPLDQSALIARVKSMLRMKELTDQVRAQAADLAAWNRTLEERVERQLTQIERMDRMERFLPPQVAELILSSGDDSVLDSHRRDVTVVFCDLRGFTAFSKTSAPEEVMDTLREYHETVGAIIHKFSGTIEHFAGDGLMALLNDPVPCPDSCIQAVRMAAEMRAAVAELTAKWRNYGFELGFGIGIAHGYATLGRIGFEDRICRDRRRAEPRCASKTEQAAPAVGYPRFLTLMRQADLPLEFRVAAAQQALPLAHRKPKPVLTTHMGAPGLSPTKSSAPA